MYGKSWAERQKGGLSLHLNAFHIPGSVSVNVGEVERGCLCLADYGEEVLLPTCACTHRHMQTPDGTYMSNSIQQHQELFGEQNLKSAYG